MLVLTTDQNSNQPPSAEWILSFLDVDIEAGKCYWKNVSKYHPRLDGKEAGGPVPCSANMSKAYWVIHINKKAFRRGKLVYAVATNGWAEVLDHINGDSLDDRAANLRAATITQNAWNHYGRNKKSPLPMGVRTTKNGGFQARLAVNKTMRHLGVYSTPEEADAVYRKARKEAFGAYSNY